MSRTSTVIVSAAFAAISLLAGSAFAQIDAGYLADTTDLKTTVSYSDAENLTDVSLALVPPQLSGGSGITLMWRARFRGRRPDVDKLAGLSLRVHYGLRSDDRRRAGTARNEDHQLSLHIDPQERGGITLDYFPATWGYGGFTAPGDEIPVAYFTVTPEELRAIAMASTLTGKALWTTFELTPKQIAALQAFSRRVLPAERPRSSGDR